MRTVSQAAIDTWIAENGCGSTVKKRRSIERPPLECVDKPQAEWERPAALHKQVKTWYQREPRSWFRPLFELMLFIRGRRAVFAVIGVLAAIFGLCWWAVCLWLG